MNTLRVSFLVTIDALLMAMLVSLLTGCVTTPQQYRNGDFVSHMASAEPVSRDRSSGSAVTASAEPISGVAPLAGAPASRSPG